MGQNTNTGVSQRHKGKIKIISVILAFSISLFSGIFLTQNHTFAAASSTNYSDTITKKAVLWALYNCYFSDAFISSTTTSEANYGNNLSKMVDYLVSSSKTVHTPTDLVKSNVGNGDIACNRLLAGGNDFEGLFALSGKSGDDIVTKLEGLGYKKQESGSSTSPCVEYTYNITIEFEGEPTETREGKTSSVCAELDSDGKITSISVKDGNVDPDSPVWFEHKIGNGWAKRIWVRNGLIHCPEYQSTRITPIGENAYWKNETGGAQAETQIQKYVGDSWQDFVSELSSEIQSHHLSYSAGGTCAYYNPITYKKLDAKASFVRSTGEDSTAGSKYVLQDTDTAASAAIAYFSGDPNLKDRSSIMLTKSEQLSYYLKQLTSHFYSGVSKSDYWMCDVDDWNLYQDYDLDIKLASDGKTRNSNCKLRSGSAKNTNKIEGINNGAFDKSELDLSQTVAAINALVDDMTDEEIADAGGAQEPSQEGQSQNPQTGTADPCWENAQSLGWILCPIKTIVKDAIDILYKGIVEPFLQVRSDLFSNDTFKSWQVFQTFANIIFVILLLAVIISQLTGIGINNYGIKKILPKLIVAAVLINLSYIICELAADISNITGQGIKNLFDNLASAYNSQSETGVPGGGFLLKALSVALVFGGTALANGGIIGALLFLIPVMISALISLAFMFILLSARQAGIVILTVIAPVAIALYMLPNTKKFFDKWVKAYSGLLMLYPICGAMLGGSNYASGLLLKIGGDNFFFAISAMLINIIPFFFIPTLLRNSFSALGNIGARISQVGRGWSRAASGAVRRNEAYRNAQARARSGIKYDRNGNVIERKTLKNAARRRFLARGGALGRAARQDYMRSFDEANRAAAQDDRAMGILGLDDVRNAQSAASEAGAGVDAAHERLNTANTEVRKARRRLRQAQTAAANATNPADQTRLAGEVTTLQDALNRAEAEQSAAQVALTEARDARTVARADLSTARADARQNFREHGRAMTAEFTTGARNRSFAQAQAERSNLTRMASATAVAAAAAGLVSKQERENVNDLKSLIRSGEMDSVVVDPDGKPRKININDIKGLQMNYEHALMGLAANPEDRDAQARVKAFGEIMSDLGDTGMSAVAESFRNVYGRNIVGANGNGGRRAMELASSHLLDGYGGQYKSGNRGMFAMLGAAASGDFSRLDQAHYNEDEWLSMGADKYTQNALANAHDTTLAGLIRTMENGSMSAADRVTIGNTARDALVNPNLDIKPEVKNQLRRLAGYSDQVTVSRDPATAGDMEERITLADGTIRTNSLGNVNTMGVHYRDAISRLDSATSRRDAANAILNNNASTDAQRAQAQTDLNQANTDIAQAQTDIQTDHATLSRSAEGRRMERNVILESAAAAVTAGTAASTATRYAAAQLDPNMYEGGFRQVLGDISNANTPLAAGSITATAAGSATAVGEYTTTREDTAAQTYRIYNPDDGQSVEVRTVGGDVRQVRDASSGTWRDITYANAGTYEHYQPVASTENSYSDRSGGIERVITLENGRTVREQVGSIDDVTSRIAEAVRNLNGENGTRTAAQNEADRTYITENARALAAAPDGGNQIREVVAQAANGHAAADIPGEGSRTLSLTLQPDVDRFNDGVRSYLENARFQRSQDQVITYDGGSRQSTFDRESSIPTQTLVNPNTGETRTVRQVDDRGSYQEVDASGHSRTIRSADLIDFVPEAQARERIMQTQTAQMNYLGSLAARGVSFDANATFQPITPGSRYDPTTGNPIPAGYSYVQDNSGHVHFFNHRTGQFTQDTIEPPTSGTP